MNNTFINNIYAKQKTSHFGNIFAKQKTSHFGNINMNIIICGTHTNRLKCFFNYINKSTIKNKKFNNCAIIKCFKNNNILNFNMIYNGDNDNPNNWTIEEFNNMSFSAYISIPDYTEIYLIRHGMGFHNQSIINNLIYKDAKLNDIGINQAINCGKFLNRYFENYSKYPINYVMIASHLIRTQQTISLIIKQLNINKPIIIAPCTHEIIYSNSCNCDSILINKIQPYSNIPNCSYNNNLQDFNESCNNVYDIKINWDYYINFYKNNKKCSNTNMIDEIINTFLFN
jgi:phosphohistidine phosphatase SixA